MRTTALARRLVAGVVLLTAGLSAPSFASAATFSTGYGFGCAVQSTGAVRCFGDNSTGQLGNTVIDSSGTTSVVVPGVSDATSVSADAYSPYGFGACAVRKTGAISCWGANGFGQLGNGTEGGPSKPVAVSGISDASAVAVGGAHACAIRTGGTVSCWGLGADGQVGPGVPLSLTGDRTGHTSTPVPVPGLTGAIAIAAGNVETCVVLTGGTVSCWGERNGSWGGYFTPTPLQGIDDATAVAVGANSACALRASGRVSCWGSNNAGQLGGGEGAASASDVPVLVTSLSDATTISVGGTHACAVRKSGAISCWGSNFQGQLGDGTLVVRRVPTPVTGITNAALVSASGLNTCALLLTGKLDCWGDGYGSTPVPIPSAGIPAPKPADPTSPTTTPAFLESPISYWDADGHWLKSTTSTTITIRNTGAETATGLTAALGGANPTQYAVSGLPSTLASGASAVITLTFTPTKQGQLPATLTIGSANGGSAVVLLTGKGRGPVATASVSSLAFGPVPVGTATSQTIVVNNTGDGLLAFSGYPKIAGTNAADFTWSGSTGSIYAGQPATFTVTFKPSAKGARTATIQFNGSAAKIPLTGTGQ